MSVQRNLTFFNTGGSFVADRDYYITGICANQAAASNLGIGTSATPATDNSSANAPSLKAVAFALTPSASQSYYVPLRFFLRKGLTLYIQLVGSGNGNIFLESAS